MPINLSTPKLENLYDVDGISLSYAMAHIKKANRKDLLVIQIDDKASTAGVFTTNKFCAAPVLVCKEHLHIQNIHNNYIRALVVNTGNANAGTGKQGLEHANLICQSLATILKIYPNQILPFSTGVILEPLPIDRILANLNNALKNRANWLEAAQTIMTTDTVAKAYSKKIILNNEEIVITGIAKGSGMIKPNMATMLSFITTNANIEQNILNNLIQNICKNSFNSITVDGDTSTNDSFILIATNKCKNHYINNIENRDYIIIKHALLEVAQNLAQAIIRDGEGATKFITINIQGGTSYEDCKKIAYTIAHSPLVKTAFFASDPNLGRILAAIGYANIEGNSIDIDKVNIYINDIQVIKHGSRYEKYTEQQGQKLMQNSEISIIVDLQLGNEKATVWTCDLSHEYVSINADYRS